MTPRQRAELVERLRTEARRLKSSIRQYDRAHKLDEGVPEPGHQRGVVIPQDLDMQDIAQRNDLLLLARVSHALDKPRDGRHVFGVCEKCGAEIAFERLQLVPWAELCLPCEARSRADEDAVYACELL